MFTIHMYIGDIRDIGIIFRYNDKKDRQLLYIEKLKCQKL